MTNLSSVLTLHQGCREPLDYVRADDVVGVTKLDRIARSTADLLALIEKIWRRGRDHDALYVE